MTQVGQEPLPVGQAASPAAATPPGRGARARIPAGTPMQKLVPPDLVQPYLTSQRSVITGFVHRAEDSVLAGLAWAAGAADPGRGSGHETGGVAPGRHTGIWVLRWSALDIQTYRRGGGPGALWAGPGPALPEPDGAAAGELFLEPGPIPVGAEMYRITPAGEEFIARHDGQAWLRPGPGT